MGFFSDLWSFIKKCGRTIYSFFKKIFTVVFKGVKFVVECIVSVITKIKNSWVGKLIDGLSFIFDLIDFLKFLLNIEMLDGVMLMLKDINDNLRI